MNEPRLTEQEKSVQRFHAVLDAMMLGEGAEPELFPSALAAAAGLALGADGAGLSIVSDGHRVPVGGSDTHAVVAERSQFTVGAGPCLQALEEGRAVRVDAEQMAVDWPAFFAEIEHHTPFRSIVAVPLTLAPDIRGALDVYFHADAMPTYAAVRAAGAISSDIAGLLLPTGSAGRTPRWDAGGLPDWAYGPQSRQRLRTWIAIGMLVADLDMDIDTALSSLRAYAYGHDIDLDGLTDDLIAGVLAPRSLA